MSEEELQELVNAITKEAAERILPQLKLINGQLRGFIDPKTREYNYEILSLFITEVYNYGMKDGLRVSSIK